MPMVKLKTIHLIFQNPNFMLALTVIFDDKIYFFTKILKIYIVQNISIKYPKKELLFSVINKLKSFFKFIYFKHLI